MKNWLPNLTGRRWDQSRGIRSPMGPCGTAAIMLLLALYLLPAADARFAEWPNTAANAPTALLIQHAIEPSIAAATNSPSSPISPAGYVPDDKYKLRPGDRVAFQIVEDREPTPKSIVVTDSGEIDVPYIGRVMASERTCKALSVEVKALLEKEYYHRATVVISLDAANKLLGRVYVWGQVKNQGAIDMIVNDNLTAGKAILRAGGFADFANKKKVKLVRSSPDGTKQTFELNMSAILEQGKTELDALLQPDDFIIVPSRLINL